ncbi:hypothetical protein [Streptomyces sp. NPDC056987]|uniref:hypothetical protein n=1 Tax=Streptomyces sp. NPDC056987 TaxID=3345988 RepID=UPI0036424504
MEFDFGLTVLGGRFHMDWRHDGADPSDLVMRWIQRAAADGDDGEEELRLLHRDVRLLLDSPLPSELIEALWRTVALFYPVDAAALRGRAWLTEIDRMLVPFVPTVPSGTCEFGMSAERVREPAGTDVSDGVIRLAEEIEPVYEFPLEPVPADLVRDAVSRCAREAGGPLAYRFLLHAYSAYGAPVSASAHTEFRRIAELCGYGEFILMPIEYLVENQ